MANRTQIVCLHEGERGRSIDPVFINKLIRALKPSWIRPFPGSNWIRAVDCGGRTDLIRRVPDELKACLAAGGQTTLMVWADVDDDPDPEKLKNIFWQNVQSAGVKRAEFDQIVFAFAKNRLENWIEYLSGGSTDESREGPRVKDRDAAEAARTLASKCAQEKAEPPLPPSLAWSCDNWKALASRMKKSP